MDKSKNFFLFDIKFLAIVLTILYILINNKNLNILLFIYWAFMKNKN